MMKFYIEDLHSKLLDRFHFDPQWSNINITSYEAQMELATFLKNGSQYQQLVHYKLLISINSTTFNLNMFSV